MSKRTRDAAPDLTDYKRQFSERKKLLIAHLDSFVRNQFFPTETVLCALLRDLSQVEIWHRRDVAGLSTVDCFRPLTMKIINERKDLSEQFKSVAVDSVIWSSTLRWQSGPEVLEIWCGFSVKSGLIGPFYLDEIPAENGSSHPSKNKSSYHKLIEDYVLPALEKQKLDPKDLSFQQDSDSIAIKDLEYLESLFFTVYSPGPASNKWPINSPDLSPVDFGIWDRFRGLLALELPKTKEEVKHWAEAFLARISGEHHVQAVREFKIRLWLCSRVRGLDFKSELQRHNSTLQVGKVCNYCIEMHDCSCDECFKKCFYKNKCNDHSFKEPFNLMEYVKDCDSRQLNPFNFNR